MSVLMFKENDKKLAVRLAESPNLYRAGIDFLKGCRGAFKPEIESVIESTLKKLDRANQIARESDYFLFSVYDSWAEEQHRNCHGFELYQHVEGKLVTRIGLSGDGPADLDEMVEKLKEHNISHVYTLRFFPKIYGGVRQRRNHGKDYVTCQGLSEEECQQFEEKGITITCTVASSKGS